MLALLQGFHLCNQQHNFDHNSNFNHSLDHYSLNYHTLSHSFDCCNRSFGHIIVDRILPLGFALGCVGRCLTLYFYLNILEIIIQFLFFHS